MTRKILLPILTVFLMVAFYFGGHFYWLQNTEQLPYRNLRDIGSASCYIAFNVEHNDSVHRVVMSNDLAAWTVRRKSSFHRYFYSLYMNEIIRHNLSVSLDDSLFSEVKYDVVEDRILKQFENYDFLKDTTILDKENRLSFDLSLKEHNAIVYLLLKDGINCCVQDLSGRVIVSR